MTATCPPALMIGEESAALRALTRPAGFVIRSVQPDREHAVLELVGTPGLESADELRRRVEGLLVADVRYLLVDLAEADAVDAVASVLAATAQRLEERQGWLRVHGQGSPLPAGLTEASLGELFAIYRGFGCAADGRARPPASAMIGSEGSS
jgi:hypothetical protein